MCSYLCLFSYYTSYNSAKFYLFTIHVCQRLKASINNCYHLKEMHRFEVSYSPTNISKTLTCTWWVRAHSVIGLKCPYFSKTAVTNQTLSECSSNASRAFHSRSKRRPSTLALLHGALYIFFIVALFRRP